MVRPRSLQQKRPVVAAPIASTPAHVLRLHRSSPRRRCASTYCCRAEWYTTDCLRLRQAISPDRSTWLTGCCSWPRAWSIRYAAAVLLHALPLLKIISPSSRWYGCPPCWAYGRRDAQRLRIVAKPISDAFGQRIGHGSKRQKHCRQAGAATILFISSPLLVRMVRPARFADLDRSVHDRAASCSRQRLYCKIEQRAG